MEKSIRTCGYRCPYFGLKDGSDYTGKCRLNEIFKIVRFGDKCHSNLKYETRTPQESLETVAA